jgi:hypothetical protein
VSVAETLLVYVAIPLAIVLFLAALTLRPGRRSRPRWKSGQPWEHEPVWFEPHPEHPAEDEHGAPAFGAAVTGGGTKAIGSSLFGEPVGESGAGHSGEDRPSGAGAASSPAVSAGPLGGARGTW